MDQRIRRAVTLATVVTLPLLAGCGSGSATSSGTAAPASSQAAASVTETPAPSVDVAQQAAQQTEQVQAATETFVKTVLTIGYPDQTFADYTARIEPLMTKDGFAALETADSVKQGSTALKTLYAQHSRSAPKFTDDPVVTSIEAASATAELAYENEVQHKSGSGWTTLKSLGKGTVTVKLVRDDEKWLVENAS
jgi:hypothetical protein